MPYSSSPLTFSAYTLGFGNSLRPTGVWSPNVTFSIPSKVAPAVAPCFSSEKTGRRKRERERKTERERQRERRTVVHYESISIP